MGCRQADDAGRGEVMTTKHDGDYRGFSHVGRAWYASQLATERHIDEVMFGLYCPDGGTSGEMAMRWYDLGRDKAPRLEAFDDAWSALAQFPDLIAALGEIDGRNITPEDFCRLLIRLGFRDDTPVDDEKRAKLEESLRRHIASAKESRS